MFSSAKTTWVTALLSLVLALGLPLAAQIGSGQIVGVVQDPTGAVIPGASVTLRHVDTGTERVISTNEVGRYRALNLQPGEYEITAESSGFGTIKRGGITLTVGQTATVDFSLQVAAAAEVVTVTEDVPIAEPDRTAYTALVSEESVENLPINGRRFTDFQLLSPTVQADGPFGLVSYRGISGLYNNNMVDGADNNQAFFSEARGRTRTPYVRSQASIKEFEVGLSNYSAEFGRAVGGTINAVTKSGGNNFHGEAFYFIRDDAFNAQNPFNKAESIEQPKDRRQQLGFSMGGPLAQDKVFWFLNYDKQHRNFPGVAVDDRGFRDFNENLFTDPAFDMSLVAEGDDPLTDDPICDFALVGNGDPVQGQARCEAARQNILDQLGVFSRKGLNDVALGKLDWNINDRHTLGGQYNYHQWRSPNGIQTQDRTNDTPLANGFDGVRSDQVLIKLNSIINDTNLNEFRFQYARDFEQQRQNAPGPSVTHDNDIDVDGFGMRNFLPRAAFPDEDRYQFVDNYSWVRGRHLIKAGIDINHVRDRQVNLFQGGGVYDYDAFQDFAMDFPISGIPTTIDAGGDGLVGTVDDLTGRHYDDFAQAFDLESGGIGRVAFDTTDWNFYIQDSWKVHPHLTLNLGLRYEFTDLPDIPQGKFGCVSAGTCPEFAGLPANIQALVMGINSDKNNWAPRVAFAWDVGGRQKFIVRAGYGLYYGRTSNSALAAGLFESDAITRASIFLESRDDPAAAPVFPNTFCTPALGTPGTDSTCTLPAVSGDINLNLFAEDYVRPLIHSGEFELEYAVTPNTSLSATYLASRGNRLPSFVDFNLPDPSDIVTIIDGSSGSTLATLPFYVRFQPFPGPVRPLADFGSVILSESVVNSWYNGLVLRAKRRFTDGLLFDFHYTWAHSLDDGQGSTTFFAFFSERVDPRDRSREYGDSRFDVRNSFTGNVVWDPPFERIENNGLRNAFEGFVFSGIVRLRDGFAHDGELNMNFSPSAVFFGMGAISTFTANGSGADDRVPWLARNFGETTGLANFDFRIKREFRFGEGKKIVFLWEAFNLFNRTNFSQFAEDAFRGDFNCTKGGVLANPGPVSTFAPCDPGSITVTATPRSDFLEPEAASTTFYRPRQMQFGFKFIW
jgi:hypothetical protein